MKKRILIGASNSFLMKKEDLEEGLMRINMKKGGLVVGSVLRRRISIGLTSKITKKGGGMAGILMRITGKEASSHVQQDWIFPCLMGKIQPVGFTRWSNSLSTIILWKGRNLNWQKSIWSEKH
jgi:hypothetical protein